MRHESLSDMRLEQRRLIRLLKVLDEYREHCSPLTMHEMIMAVTVNEPGCEPVEIGFSMHEVETQVARKLGLLTAEIARSEEPDIC